MKTPDEQPEWLKLIIEQLKKRGIDTNKPNQDPKEQN